MQASIHANKRLYNEVRRDLGMREALRELGNLPEGAVSRPQEHDRAAEVIGVRYPEGPFVP